MYNTKTIYCKHCNEEIEDYELDEKIFTMDEDGCYYHLYCSYELKQHIANQIN